MVNAFWWLFGALIDIAGPLLREIGIMFLRLVSQTVVFAFMNSKTASYRAAFLSDVPLLLASLDRKAAERSKMENAIRDARARAVNAARISAASVDWQSCKSPLLEEHAIGDLVRMQNGLVSQRATITWNGTWVATHETFESGLFRMRFFKHHGTVLFGFLDADASRKSDAGVTKDAFVIDSGTPVQVVEGGVFVKRPGKWLEAPNGCFVECVVDVNAGSLTYAVNGNHAVTAFSSRPKEQRRIVGAMFVRGEVMVVGVDVSASGGGGGGGSGGGGSGVGGGSVGGVAGASAV